MKIGEKNVDKFSSNNIDRKEEIKNFLTKETINKIIRNSMYGFSNYIVCNSSLIKTLENLKDAIDK